MATKKKGAAPNRMAYLDAAQAAMERARQEGTTIKAIRHEGYTTCYDFDGSKGELWTVSVNGVGNSCTCPARTICKHQGAVLIHRMEAADAQRREIEADEANRAAALPTRPVDRTGPFLYRGAF